MAQDIFVIFMAGSVLVGQLAQCMLGSRCTEIKTPCCELKRDVLSAEELEDLRRTRVTKNQITPPPAAE